MKTKPKGLEHGAEIDASTYERRIPKLVSEKIREIMANHVFPKCKNMQKYCSGHQFEGVDAECANGKGIKKPYTNMSKSNLIQIDEQPMLNLQRSDA